MLLIIYKYYILSLSNKNDVFNKKKGLWINDMFIIIMIMIINKNF